MNFLDLFAGIGGFRLGMEMAGHEPVGYVEFDKFARRSYQAMYDTKGEWTKHDITTVTDDDIRQLGNKRRVDVITGGFPCQAFSIAGKRKGFDDTRGTLFFEIARFANILRPRYLFLENVKGLFSHDNGDTFETILRTLDELGYDCEWDLLNSKDFGVPQNRERVFIIGHLRGASTRKVFPIEGTDEQTNLPVEIVAHRKGYRRNTQVFSPEGITETLDTGQGGGRGHYTIIDDQGRRNKELKQLDTVPTLRAQSHGNEPKVVMPVLTPDRLNKRQNGRRFKDGGEPMFTLTSQDRHGILTYDLVQKVRVRKHDVDIDRLKELLRAHKESIGLTNKQIAESTNKRLTLVEHWFRKDNSFSIPGEDVWFELKKLLKITTSDFDAPITEFIEKDNEFEKSNRVYDSRGIAPTITSANADERIIEPNYKIRKLTPKECFRLQGFPDELFDKAAEVNSDSQLYKQAGNSVTVNVIYEIAKRLI